MAKKNNRGPRGKYALLKIEDRLPEIEQMARDGYRDEDIYNSLGIARQTYYNWVKKYPEFAEAIRKGKAVVDAEIENKLLENARGHVFWEVTEEPVYNEETRQMELTTTKRVLKYVKPDTTAQIFWLKNRLPDKWRDKQHIEHEGQVGVMSLDHMSDEEIEKALKEFEADE